MESTKVLVTGTNSGLGKFFSRQFEGCDRFTRDTPLDSFRGTTYDLVIHCAVNLSHYSWDDEIPFGFYDDNIFLTQRLLGLDYRKFVYVSSIDQAKGTPYGVVKRISEALVRELAPEHLILRPSGMLGREMKKNTFQKILAGEPIALTADSTMNYVLYDDVLAPVARGDSGTVTVRASENITMAEVCEEAGVEVPFGGFKFEIEVGSDGVPLPHTSRENIRRYLDLHHERKD